MSEPRSRRSFPVLLMLLTVSLLSGCGGSDRPPVVVIGLDGADYDLLLPWIEAGELPNLKAFLDQAAVGELTTVYPILSPVCWTSAVTGVNPGKHGIYDFQKTDFEGGPPLIEQATNRRALPIWLLLSDWGYRVGVMNVPMTYPPDPVRGDMISGFPFPDGDVVITYPPELHETLGEYPVDFLGLSMRNRTPDQLYADFLKGQAARGRVAKEWIRSGKYDFLWLVFTGTDKVQHFFWKYMDPNHPAHDPAEARKYGNAIKELWKKQDAILGELLAELPPDATVLMLSDHGFEGVYHQLNMANWLVDTELKDWLGDHTLPPMLITNGILHYVLEGEVSGENDRGEFIDIFSRLCRGLQDPRTGTAPFESVFSREELYDGRMLPKAPDVVFQESPFYYVTRGNPDSTDLPVFQDIWSTSFSAHHRPEGILAVRGPSIRAAGEGSLRERLAAGGEFDHAGIMDVTPTLLALMGQCIPEGTDGRVLEEGLRAEFLEGREIERCVVDGFLLGPAPERELSREEQERLIALPYLGND